MKHMVHGTHIKITFFAKMQFLSAFFANLSAAKAKNASAERGTLYRIFRKKDSRYQRVRCSYLATYTLPPQPRLCVHTPPVWRQPLR